MARPTRAGSSAAVQDRRRKAVQRPLNQALALVCLLAAATVFGLLVGWLYALAALGVVFIITNTLIVIGKFQKKPLADSWSRGAIGEQMTERKLSRLGFQGYVVIHDVALGNSHANIDHLVIGPTGVFVLDSKNWRGKAHMSAKGVWTYGSPVGQTAQATMAEANYIAQFLQPELGMWNVPVYAAWVMTGAQQSFTAIDDLHVIALDDLANFITNRYRVISRRQVKRIGRRADMLRPA